MEQFTQGFGGSTFSFMWQETALTAMRKMRAIGLNNFDALVTPGHLWPDELSASDRSSLVATLRREDIRVESLNLPAHYPSFLGFSIHNLFEFFMVMVILPGAAAVLLFLISGLLKKKMHGVR